VSPAQSFLDVKNNLKMSKFGLKNNSKFTVLEAKQNHDFEDKIGSS